MSEQQGAAPPTAALIEELAALSHTQWSGWAEWMFEKWDKTHVSGESYYSRWKRQIATPYADLSEDEKESDRIEARKVLALVDACTDARVAEAVAPLLVALRGVAPLLREREWSAWRPDPDSIIPHREGRTACPVCEGALDEDHADGCALAHALALATLPATTDAQEAARAD